FSRFRSKPQSALPHVTRTFQAIPILQGAKACTLAKDMAEVRFLAKDARPLPLPGCNMPSSCECVYLKHRDRRGPQRRTMDFSASQRVYVGRERRVLKGRRATD